MQKIHETIFINAPREKVWDTMLEDATYREWTSAFNPGSYYKGSWEQGSKILFLGPNPDGTSGEGGMVSRIAENKLHEFVSIEHVGVLANGVEDTTSDFAKAWTPAFENYTFVEKDGGTELTIDVDVAEEMKEEMEKMWKAALTKLKQMAENS